MADGTCGMAGRLFELAWTSPVPSEQDHPRQSGPLHRHTGVHTGRVTLELPRRNGVDHSINAYLFRRWCGISPLILAAATHAQLPCVVWSTDTLRFHLPRLLASVHRAGQ